MIVIDGEQFKIDVLSVKRSADFLDKYAERLANGHLRRELIGVYFNYKLQFGPGLDRKEYARLWDKLTEPVEFHEVTVPDEDGDYSCRKFCNCVVFHLIDEVEQNPDAAG